MERHEACQLRAQLNELSNMAWALNRRLNAAAHTIEEEELPTDSWHQIKYARDRPAALDQDKFEPGEAPSSAMVMDRHTACLLRADIQTAAHVASSLNTLLETLKNQLPDDNVIRAVKRKAE
jgi:hypothetical protein